MIRDRVRGCSVTGGTVFLHRDLWFSIIFGYKMAICCRFDRCTIDLSFKAIIKHTLLGYSQVNVRELFAISFGMLSRAGECELTHTKPVRVSFMFVLSWFTLVKCLVIRIFPPMLQAQHVWV